MLALAKKSWVYLKSLKKEEKNFKKNGGPPELEAWPPIWDGAPFSLAAIKTAICVCHFMPISRNQRLLQYKL